MARTVRGTSNALTTLLATSVAIAATVTVLGIAGIVSHVLSLRAEASAPASTAQTINRERKSDALAFSQAAQPRLEIKSVEVVGVRDAAIVYRDRDGNILFRTDPLANVTVITKNVDLPAVTIRESADTEVERFDVEKDTKVERFDTEKKPPVNPLEATPGSPPPPGCESAFARPSPEALTNKSGRCLAALKGSREFAAAFR